MTCSRIVTVVFTILTCLAVVPASAQVGTGIFRVDIADIDAFDGAGCGSEETPCMNIQSAVDQAFDGDVILVATGTYTYQAGLDPCTSGITGVVCIRNITLTLRGGYAAPDWTKDRRGQDKTTGGPPN